MHILGLIPARGGSKSIPNKNIVDLGGQPLIAYTIQAAQHSALISQIVVSTDDAHIADVARNYGAEVPFIRPPDLAHDQTPALPVIQHAIEHLTPDIVIYLQPTSPFRRAQHIDEATQILLNTGADSVVSVVQVPHQYNPVSIFRLEDERLIPYVDTNIQRRQDKPRYYARNGPAVLVMRRETITQQATLYGTVTLPYIMSEEDSLDIDTAFDLKIARCMMSEYASR